MTKLSFLDLSGNSIGDTLPSELGALSELTYFGVYCNRITQSVPSSFGKLTNMQVFSTSFK